MHINAAPGGVLAHIGGRVCPARHMITDSRAARSTAMAGPAKAAAGRRTTHLAGAGPGPGVFALAYLTRCSGEGRCRHDRPAPAFRLASRAGLSRSAVSGGAFGRPARGTRARPALYPADAQERQAAL